MEGRTLSHEIDELRARIAAAAGGRTAEDDLRTLRREIHAIHESLVTARDAADAALVELQLRRLDSFERAARVSRLRSLLEMYDVAVEELEATADPAVAGLILRLRLRRTRVAQKLEAAQ